jgi:hypothetical protein
MEKLIRKGCYLYIRKKVGYRKICNEMSFQAVEYEKHGGWRIQRNEYTEKQYGICRPPYCFLTRFSAWFSLSVSKVLHLETHTSRWKFAIIYSWNQFIRITQACKYNFVCQWFSNFIVFVHLVRDWNFNVAPWYAFSWKWAVGDVFCLAIY